MREKPEKVRGWYFGKEKLREEKQERNETGSNRGFSSKESFCSTSVQTLAPDRLQLQFIKIVLKS